MDPLIDFLPVDADSFEFNDRMVYRLMIDTPHADLAWAKEILGAHAVTANGPGWEGLVVYFLGEEAPDLLASSFVSSDQEVVTIDTPDEQSLEDLHRLVLTLILDRKTLLYYLSTLPDAYRA